jgi:hypothetical protein
MSADDAEPGVVNGQPILDLSHLTSAGELAGISRINRVATVIVPQALAAAYATIPKFRVANTIFVPDGANVRVHTGALVVGGDGLGSADDVLVVVGVLIVTSPVSGPMPTQISVVGSVLAPRGSEGTLGPALSGGTGSVTYFRYVEGQEIKLFTGQVKLSGTSLANPAGSPADVLLAAGQVIVTGEVSKIGFSQVVASGQLILPARSRDILEPRVQANGQVLWYQAAEPRILLEDTEIGADYFRLLDHPISLVVLGDLTITENVPHELIREKVTDIALLGDLTAPAELVPLLQVLTTEAFGSIRVADGSGS